MTETEETQARPLFKQLAEEFITKGDPTGWFEVLYQTAQGNEEAIPWGHMTANPLFIQWATDHHLQGLGRKALVVGCGLGDDAEALAHLGFQVVAFDISPEAIAWCERRFPGSQVQYRVADALALPSGWSKQFDFILECYTLQSLPDETLRVQAMHELARCLAPSRSLLVICRGRDEHEAKGTMPWPVTRTELAVLQQQGLQEEAFEVILDQKESLIRYFRVHYCSQKER